MGKTFVSTPAIFFCLKNLLFIQVFPKLNKHNPAWILGRINKTRAPLSGSVTPGQASRLGLL